MTSDRKQPWRTARKPVISKGARTLQTQILTLYILSRITQIQVYTLYIMMSTLYIITAQIPQSLSIISYRTTHKHAGAA